MESAGGKSGLVLAGGGARAAYQVGVLQALKEVLPEPRINPFAIICGTSAGAVNAGALAVHADDFARAVDNLLGVWRNFEPRHVYRADFAGATANSVRWFLTFMFGAFIKNYDITYPFLIAGDTDHEAAALPQAVNLNTFPATFILGKDGRVRATHAGYASKATGPHYMEEQKEFLAELDRLLAEK